METLLRCGLILKREWRKRVLQRLKRGGLLFRRRLAWLAAMSVFMPDLSFSPDATVSVRRVGQEDQPVLVIDGAMAHPDNMVEIARRVPFRAPDRSMYPGVTAPLPPIYFRELLRKVRPLLSDMFGIWPEVELTAHGFLALATRPPEALHPMQKIPHQDAADPMRLGMVHYFCQAPHAGTAFFRHTATGFETVDAARREVFAPIAIEELKAQDASSMPHVGPETRNYDMTGQVEAQFNRLIIYRANLLHAGLLEGAALSDDPDAGRLTANVFVGEGAPE